LTTIGTVINNRNIFGVSEIATGHRLPLATAYLLGNGGKHESRNVSRQLHFDILDKTTRTQ
jgi:hypothetical protein